MALDMKKIMILLQRKYSSIREIANLTKELEEAFARNDEVSATMLLQMRADEMEKIERCMEEIWRMGESGREDNKNLRILITSDPAKATGASPEERKIYEIRKKTQETLNSLRVADERLNRKLTGDKSYYCKANALR